MPQDQHSKDKQAAIQWARDILDNGNWAILDTETTGFDYKAEICQIGVLTSDDTESLEELVKPSVAIHPDAFAVHGIQAEDLALSLSFDDLFMNILKVIGRRDLIIYNADYDLRMIRQSLKARGIQIAFPTSDRRQCRIFTNGGSIHCAMNWYSQFVGEWNDYHGNYKWQKLPGGDHSALGDCRAVLEVIKGMAEHAAETAPIT